MTVAAVSLNTQESLVNQALNASQRVTQAIRQASAKAGVDFAYMLNKASQESSLNPTAKSRTSSATGLFQFIEQTWLRTVKSYGEKYGLSEYADRITIGSDGVARVKDSQSKKAILEMRKDPSLSACMAAELTNQNKTALQSEIGGKIGSTELYLAHFLGAGGAADFLKAMRSNPNASAAAVLPEAASANKAVFYGKDGCACTLKEIYNKFAAKFEKTPCTAYASADIDAANSAASTVLNEPSATASAGSAAYNNHGSSDIDLASSLGLDSSTSSVFATMVLAQTDFGDMSSSVSESDSSSEKNKKDAFFAANGPNG